MSAATVVLDRRAFLQLTGLTAGAFVLGVRGTALAGKESDGHEFDLFLSIHDDGTVRIVAHRSEMGQGIRTALPMVVADELEADFDRVEIVQALADERYGSQNTDGSHSIREFFEPMRKVGATARHMLVAAAAETWGVPASECRASLHEIHHEASGRKLGYGALAEKAAAVPVPEESALQLKSRDQWRYIGKGRTLVDLTDIVTGKAIFGIDAKAEGMLHASIERCPVVGGKLTAYDEAAAMKVKGVRHVIEMPSGGTPPGFKPIGGVAVLADHTWAAMKGREALSPKWDLGERAAYDSQAFRKEMEATAAKPGSVFRERGDVDAALAAGAKKLVADYYAPHLAHSPMEPPAALASFADDRCEVWACTQNPVGAVEEVAKALGIPKESVTVHVTLLGGGFGRKSKPDFIVEAALLSKQVGRPVKVTWTREDEIRHGYYHTVSAQHVEGALDADGKPTAWLHRSVFPSINTTFGAADAPQSWEVDLGLTEMPYDVPNLRMEYGVARQYVRTGWLRSVANIYHAFAVSSFVDELAHAAGADPKEFLLRLIPDGVIDLSQESKYGNYGASIEDYPVDGRRLRNVIEIAAKAGRWGRALPKGRGLGIAAHRSFLTYVAVVAEVSVDERGEAKLEEAHIAMDCGTFVNRDTVLTQAQGAVVFALSGALYGNITAKGGAIEQSNFHDYPLARYSDTPRVITAHVVDSEAPPAGVGEPGVPPVAPAIANAIFAACGERRRELPLASRQA